MFLLGTDLNVFVGGTAVASAKQCGIELECDLIETATNEASTRTFIVSRLAWKMEANALLTSLSAAMQGVGTKVTVSFGSGSGNKASGEALWTDCKITGSRGSHSTCSLSFKGTEALSRSLADLFWATINSEYYRTSAGEKIRLVTER